MELICPAVLRGCGLHKNSAVLAAFSGGADSTALVLELARLSRQGELGAVYAAHYHHGIRGGEAERDLAFCRALCQRLGIPFLFERGDVPAAAREKGISVESAENFATGFFAGPPPGPGQRPWHWVIIGRIRRKRCLCT